ncbi:MAG: T9SS type A sorting domain-containing protein, partial [Chlorobi bacterium]|nr:T9SS type A sorting domain-containing protein [Chlorobiota bacterium]
VPSIFTFSGNADWTRVQGEAYDGDYSMKSGSISNSDTSSMQTELNITTAGNISFYKKVSSELTYDYLRFDIDDVSQGSWSGTVDWSQVSYPVTSGTHTFKWIYLKDANTSDGSDCAWVDYIDFPEHDTSGTEDFNKSKIIIFPNPSYGNFTIKSTSKIKKIIITDITGRLVKTINPAGNNQVFVSDLNSGIFILSIFSDTDIVKRKVVIN